MARPNKLSQMVNKINGLNIPSSFKEFALTALFNSQVKFAGTAGIRIASLNNEEAVVHLKNKWRVQNHIKGIHACGMALLAESATGVVFGSNVPDTHLPLIKSMHVDYKSRAIGDMKAVATLSPEEIQRIKTTEKGDIIVPVTLTDANGNSPVNCSMQWAWVPKKR